MTDRKLLVDTVHCMIERGIPERHCVRAIKYYGFDVFYRAAQSLYNQGTHISEDKFFNYLNFISPVSQGTAPKQLAEVLAVVVDILETRFSNRHEYRADEDQDYCYPKERYYDD